MEDLVYIIVIRERQFINNTKTDRFHSEHSLFMLPSSLLLMFLHLI